MLERPSQLNSSQRFELEQVRFNSISFGIYLPTRIITNEEIEKWMVQTPNGRLITADEIKKRIGVERRYQANPSQSALDLGIQASVATQNLEEIEAVITSTSYPLGVNVSAEISISLQIKPDKKMDIHAACSGFVRGLTYMKENESEFNGKKVLFVATELYSHTLEDLRDDGIKRDPSMAQTIFSDGAVAIVFRFGQDLKVLAYKNEKIPEEYDHLIQMPIDRNLMTEPYIEEPVPSECSTFQQNGPKVYEEMRTRIPDLNKNLIEESGLEPSDIKLVIPHQASGRMIDAIASRMPEYKIYKDIRDGNFSSASIPKAMIRAIKEGQIETGDKILLSGFGAGMYASSAIVELG
ncbi:MAG: hypothetical protein ACD_50C00343G0015 [uncultured bacterium]|nr:MAG: hypothetical protein ACD_50C00343G0015 [uncultured bacterium]OGH13255.1 MAG: hypothetical protein A2687_03885 [Candidatus Levybacteria bacterium RIFCSPHIGHO2_01_FULL_38_26]